MKIIKPSVEILTPIDGEWIIKHIERCGRTCYKSEDKITDESAFKFVKGIVNSEHLSVIEHFNITVKFITDRAITHEIVRHRLASYCLTGDTEIRSYHKNKRYSGKKWTIKQLYDWQSDYKRKGRIKLINLRSVDENMIIVPNKIKQIIYSGIKDVYLVKTKTGREIKSTLQHRFYTPDGYKQLRELSVGNKIYANGLPALENEEYLRQRYLTDNITRKELAKEIGCCEAYVYKAFQNFNIFKPWSNRPNRHAGYGKKGMFSEEQKEEISKRMKGENSPNWKGDNIKENSGRLRANKMYQPDKCWGCGSTENLERHHYNKNPKNNNPENIYFVCSACHKAFHFKDIKTVFSDEISEITYIGKEETYDIEMQDNPHNFVANGLVVHNSQESTRYCNYSNDKFDNQLTFILPPWVNDITCGEHQIKWSGIYGLDSDINNRLDKPSNRWFWSMAGAERDYNRLIIEGWTPEKARSILPNSLKTEIVMTANLREWRHFLKLRTGKTSHPQMREVAIMLLREFQNKIPVVFDDIEVID